ncbi:hypothetical protein F0562_004395 [Nyssa sinensis]|uniref:Uncharacterized protein n=1 Tax=Nyssa sinensis TaxID=561372 RepID=A0A5J5BZ91_9ASTE|nr:hypothetical protein F0562_004395 [Nyssa sinensis]
MSGFKIHGPLGPLPVPLVQQHKAPSRALNWPQIRAVQYGSCDCPASTLLFFQLTILVGRDSRRFLRTARRSSLGCPNFKASNAAALAKSVDKRATAFTVPLSTSWCFFRNLKGHLMEEPLLNLLGEGSWQVGYILPRRFSMLYELLNGKLGFNQLLSR